MQFQIPQFIEIEDKIFGPLMFKQGMYLGGGAAMCFVMYKILPFILAVVGIMIVGGFSLALAFYKINNKSFIEIVESAIAYTFNKKLYIWKKVPKKIDPRDAEAVAPQVFVPRLSESKLKDIAWSLDVHESIYSGERQKNEPQVDQTKKKIADILSGNTFSNPTP